MALVVISINRDKFPEHTDEEFRQWVHYKVCENGSLNRNNPLVDLELDATVKEISREVMTTLKRGLCDESKIRC